MAVYFGIGNSNGMPTVIYLSLIAALLSVLLSSGYGTTDLEFSRKYCPCSNPELCWFIWGEPDPVVGFSTKNDINHWNKYPWSSRLNTLVTVGYFNDTLMCLAHTHKVRLTYLAEVTNSLLADPRARTAWTLDQITIIRRHFLDGIHLHFVGEMGDKNSTLRDSFTALVVLLNDALKKAVPTAQLTIQVPWKRNMEQQYYDFSALAYNYDHLYVRAYDEQSQIFGDCVAMPNSGYFQTIEAIKSYMPVSTSVVIGLPLYGYIYPCTRIDGDKCFIKPVPYRGAHCSDRAGKRYPYSYIRKLASHHTVQWNSTSYTPYFTFTSTTSNQSLTSSYQVHFDNPHSLFMKMRLKEILGVNGVGLSDLDDLDYGDTAEAKKSRDDVFAILP